MGLKLLPLNMELSCFIVPDFLKCEFWAVLAADPNVFEVLNAVGDCMIVVA